MFQLKERQVAPEQNPVVDFIDGLEVRIDFLQKGVAERVEGTESNSLCALRFRFPAIASRRHYAVLHFRGGFVSECQAQNFPAGEFRLRFKQIADALGDHASLARARAGHHDKRSLAVLCRGALLGIELNARRRGPGMFKQVGHLGSSQATTVAHRVRGGINKRRYNRNVIVRLGTKIYVTPH